MWSLGVEFLDEVVEAFLLLKQVLTSWAGSFSFERAMHSLVPAVVLGVGWAASLEHNSETKPVGRQFR